MKSIFAVVLIAVMATACSSTDKQGDAKEQAKVEAQHTAQLAKLEANKNVLKCELNKDIRIVELSKESKAKVCEVHYTKSGEKERIASAERQANFCGNVLGNVKNNLQSAGFNCSM